MCECMGVYVGLRHRMHSGGERSPSVSRAQSILSYPRSGTGRPRAGTLASPKQSQSNAL